MKIRVTGQLPRVPIGSSQIVGKEVVSPLDNTGYSCYVLDLDPGSVVTFNSPYGEDYNHVYYCVSGRGFADVTGSKVKVTTDVMVALSGLLQMVLTVKKRMRLLLVCVAEMTGDTAQLKPLIRRLSDVSRTDEYCSDAFSSAPYTNSANTNVASADHETRSPISDSYVNGILGSKVPQSPDLSLYRSDVPIPLPYKTEDTHTCTTDTSIPYGTDESMPCDTYASLTHGTEASFPYGNDTSVPCGTGSVPSGTPGNKGILAPNDTCRQTRKLLNKSDGYNICLKHITATLHHQSFCEESKPSALFCVSGNLLILSDKGKASSYVTEGQCIVLQDTDGHVRLQTVDCDYCRLIQVHL